MILKKNIPKAFYLFLISHLIIWSLIPAFTNTNLPLDTIEALAWGSNLDWGFNKHPPFSAFTVEVIFQLFGNQDWAYYVLSQIFVIVSFYVIFKLSKEFYNNHFAFISVIILEGIYFFNYTTPEFNVNISQLPFWALSALFTWRCINYNKTSDYVLLGIFLGLGILSKYLFLYLVVCIKFYFIYIIIEKKKINPKFLIVSLILLLIISPHIFWLFENNFTTIAYGLKRAGGIRGTIDHITFPILFTLKQLGILIPFFILTFFLVKKLKVPKIKKNKKLIFLFFIFLLPIILIIITSALLGAKIRTMWMTPFYLLLGILIIEIFKHQIDIKKIKKFYITFFFFFFLSPLTYMIVSLNNDFKRTDYPGKEIARLVQNKWDKNFMNNIEIVVGDEWFAGNLSYHLATRPRWFIELKDEQFKLNEDQGVIYTGNPKVLKEICPGVYGTIKPVGYCMIGRK